MPPTKSVSPFFDLPLELREEIYKSVLFSPSQGPDILRTCREIHFEARKFLFQKPLSFQSQTVLYTWLDEAPSALLAHVSEIALHVQDVNLKPILDSGATMLQHRSHPRLMTLELYQRELDRLKQALKRVPKVKTLTIRVSSGQSSYLYRDFVAHILSGLGTLYPYLLDLRMEGDFHYQELEFLSKLEHLESFSFDGFSSSSPAVTANILANLQHLSNLSLVSEHALLATDTDLNGGFTAKQQSFNGDVACRISQLASFSVIERFAVPSPTVFFTLEVLASLQDHKSLKSISIHLSHTPSTAILESLEEFLEKTPIELLELDWPDLEPFVLERYRLLARSVKVLWVRARSESDAFEILWSIVESREAGDICELKKVVLVRSLEVYADMHNGVSDRKDSGVGEFGPGDCNVSSSHFLSR
jgi:hypothetical protein